MTAYQGLFARYYDLFYADKDYGREAGFVHGLVRTSTTPPRLLDLACGTGRHAREFARLGYDVTAVDASEAMVAQARQRAAGESVELRVADMTSASLPPGSFDVATCLFDSIGYLVTNDRIIQALARTARALRPGGVLVLEFWHAPAMLRGYDATRVRRFQTEQGEIVRISETELDVASQTATVSYDTIHLTRDGVEREGERHVNRYFQVQEMASLLAAAGFAPARWFDGFTQQPVSGDTWHVVVLAESVVP